jgi:NADPH:quinone reductase-like Zn-dependent oxidoreductase
MCAGVTVYSDLRHSGYRRGNRVAVIALGGLGHLGVLYAKAMGARVAVVSSTKAKEQEARSLGAEVFIDLREGDAAQKLQSWAGGANVTLATAPNVESASKCFAGLAPDATMVVLGVGPGFGQHWRLLWCFAKDHRQCAPSLANVLAPSSQRISHKSIRMHMKFTGLTPIQFHPAANFPLEPEVHAYQNVWIPILQARRPIRKAKFAPNTQIRLRKVSSWFPSCSW